MLKKRTAWFLIGLAMVGLSLSACGGGGGGKDGYDDDIDAIPRVTDGTYYIQSRSSEYESYFDRTFVYASLGSSITFDNIESIFLLDSSGNVVLSKDEFSEYDDYLYHYRCDVNRCTFSNLRDFYFFASIPDAIPPGNYTFKLQTYQGEVTTNTVYYPGKVFIPHIDSETVSAEWGSDGSLSIAWQNPTLGSNWHLVDSTRINIFSQQDGSPYLTIIVPKDTSFITIPSNVIEKTFSENEKEELRIVHHTRAYDEQNHNYSRAYSFGLSLRKPMADLAENIVYDFFILPNQTSMYKFTPKLDSYYTIFLTNAGSDLSWDISTTTNIEDYFFYCDESYFPGNEICTTQEKLIKDKNYYIFVEEWDNVPTSFSLTIQPTNINETGGGVVPVDPGGDTTLTTANLIGTSWSVSGIRADGQPRTGTVLFDSGGLFDYNFADYGGAGFSTWSLSGSTLTMQFPSVWTGPISGNMSSFTFNNAHGSYTFTRQ